jgi:hypothetical protein
MIDPRRAAEVLVAAPKRTEDVDEALAWLDEEPLVEIDPVAIWLLVGLVRHLPRQRWVGEVVKALGGDLTAIGAAGALAHPEGVEACGRVPGHEDWRYELHGRGCCLTHDDGTTLDVDFVGGGSEVIDPFFYGSYLRTVATPTLVEERLRRARPLDESWMAFVPVLRDAGWVEGEHGLRLTPAGQEAAATLEEIVDAIEEPVVPAWRKAYLAAVLGDWALAHDIALSAGPVSQMLEQLADQHRIERARELRQRLADAAPKPFEVIPLLQGLADLGRDVAEGDVLAALLRDPPDGATSTALEIVAEWVDPVHEPTVLDVLERCTGDQPPQPHLRQRVIELVLSRYTPATLPPVVRERILTAMRSDGAASEGAIAFLEHVLAPEAGLGRLARALDHRVPVAREEAAAGLVLIGTESARVLRGHDGPEAKAALAVLEGRPVEPGPEPVGELVEVLGRQQRVYSMDEIAASNCPDWTSSVIEVARARWGAPGGAVVLRRPPGGGGVERVPDVRLVRQGHRRGRTRRARSLAGRAGPRCHRSARWALRPDYVCEPQPARHASRPRSAFVHRARPKHGAGRRRLLAAPAPRAGRGDGRRGARAGARRRRRRPQGDRCDRDGQSSRRGDSGGACVLEGPEFRDLVRHGLGALRSLRALRLRDRPHDRASPRPPRAVVCGVPRSRCLAAARG